MKSNILIIGQGIAGSTLAYELIKLEQSVTIIDNNHDQSSSIVSAGIINPVIGKRFTILEGFDGLFARAVSFYGDLDKQFGETFFEAKPIVRIFQTEEERDDWTLRAKANPKQYNQRLNASNTFYPAIDDPFGSILITTCGFCHSAKLIQRFKTHFQERNILQNKKCAYAYMKVDFDGVEVSGQRYDKVIFCEGFQAQNNPWFNTIPFQCVKGEILKVKFKSHDLPDAIINKGKWAAPLGNGLFSAGSNYIWETLDCHPTEKGMDEIVNGLKATLGREVEVVSHQAAVRPVTTDQQPVLGLHPQYSSLGIFNGLGSKGFLLAPTYAAQLADFLCGRGVINPKVNISRFTIKT
jgi:glycine/D-amino acid oxidase-like deaminating enzyme